MICLLGFTAYLAQSAKSNDVKGKYQNIEVVKFDIKQGVKFPAGSLDVMMAEIVDELKKLERFKQVAIESEAKTDTGRNVSELENKASEATIRLSGTVTKYKPGNRTARYLVGSAGATKVVTHIKFIDTATGKVLFEKEIDGKVIIGFFGGDSSDATRGLAREVAQLARKKFSETIYNAAK